MQAPQTGSDSPTSFVFAHISDPHLTSLPDLTWRELLNKRAVGYRAWRRRPKACSMVLDQLRADVLAGKPDHIAVTGDLTNLGTPSEYTEAAEWLTSLGNNHDVSVVPGNHDCYVRDARVDPLRDLGPWLASDEPGRAGFPFVRCRGPVAFIGVSSACPTPIGMATGRLGGSQMRRLASALRWTGEASYCRVLLIHHPPLARAVSRRKSLTDAPELRRVLAEQGAELVVHGHAHRFMQGHIEAGGRALPVLGAPAAASSVGGRSELGGYYQIRVDSTGEGWALGVEARGWRSPEAGFAVVD